MTQTMLEQATGFWIGRQGWPQFDPVEPKPHVFLGRAAMALGPVIHGSAWTGLEPVSAYKAPLAPLPEDRSSASLAQLMRAWRRSERCKIPADQEPNLSSLFAALDLKPDQFTDEEWEAARQAEAAEILHRTRTLGRWFAVQDALAGAMATKALPFMLQDPKSLDLVYLGKPSFWTGVHWRNHFISCRLNPLEPDSLACGGAAWRRIFVDADAFGALMDQLAPAEAEVDAGGESADQVDDIQVTEATVRAVAASLRAADQPVNPTAVGAVFATKLVGQPGEKGTLVRLKWVQARDRIRKRVLPEWLLEGA